MSSDLYVSLAGALARLRELDVVANNLANVDTPGFKRDRISFEAALETTIEDLEPSVEGAPGRVFTAFGPAGVDFRAGAVARTGAPLDAAIDGPGFFEVDTPSGPRFTRAGSFSVNGAGQLATADGHAVRGDAGPIAVGDRSVTIASSGEVLDEQQRALGRLQIVDFDEPALLEKEGANLFRAPAALVPEAVPGARLIPNSVERSNVQAVEELAHLVTLQRAFDIAVRAMQSDDEATQRLIQEISQ
ncbi:MAG: flagellar hook-basal body protein [Myxococcota bacterium]|nr:flagellar hook-basal body protein [Myxococcota bacterium]